MSADRNELDFSDEGQPLIKVRVWVGWPFHAGQFNVNLPAELFLEPKTNSREIGRDRAMHKEDQIEQPIQTTLETKTVPEEVVLIEEEPRAFEG